MHISESVDQPAATLSATTSWTPDLIKQEVSVLKHKPGALLPILHAIQDKVGYIPKDAVAIIAEELQQTRADVHGVISFYHHFRTEPAGSHIVEVCRAEACQAQGGREFERHVKQKLGVDYTQTSADREFTLAAVYCLGNCACGPSIRVNNAVYGRMNAQKFDQLADQLTTTILELK
ncbi:formate dehydrogenase subunit gamma [Aliidiomarina quisquiliarum]|uniref:formate dehydrogenase subunit gamma n=1 Tax=Aliidiomarina quisquiliarum TaxID=2938947 RepID=UPI00208EC051|nr:formate dehydrogenase subunit gamma [Aliidiomarina quisquiliarum]MCO4321505.1 formate dehydrogenase subunit gamma [Aliidiomarina quisquiliarum]